MKPTVETFLAAPVEAAGTHALRALWHAGHGSWHAAHEEAQATEDAEAAWVHAMLHREEGDTFNASYWYRRAGKPVCRLPLDQEWEEMVCSLLPPGS